MKELIFLIQMTIDGTDQNSVVLQKAINVPNDLDDETIIFDSNEGTLDIDVMLEYKTLDIDNRITSKRSSVPFKLNNFLGYGLTRKIYLHQHQKTIHFFFVDLREKKEMVRFKRLKDKLIENKWLDPETEMNSRTIKTIDEILKS